MVDGVGGPDDFELVISAVLDTDSADVLRAFRVLSERLAAEAEASGAKAGARGANAFSKAQQQNFKRFEKLYGKAASDAFAAFAKAQAQSGGDLNKAQVRQLDAALRALRSFFTKREELLNAQKKEERAEERKRYSFGLVAEKEAAQARLKTLAAVHRERLAEKEREAKAERQVDRQNHELALQDIRQANRLQFQAQQAGDARSLARARALQRIGTSVVQTGLAATLSAWRSHLTKRENLAKQADTRITNNVRNSMRTQTSVVVQQLNAQNAEYTRAAARRIATIERTAANETKVITRGQVKQAEALAVAQKQLNAGVLGAATGRSGLGAGGVAGLLGGGLVGRRIFDTLADFQSIETSFRGIFNEVEGGAPKTQAFLKEMQAFAKSTPFTLRSLAEFSQKFFANKLVDPKSPRAIDDLKKKLLQLADAASATGKTQAQIEGAVLGITQISASGRLSLEDLRQVTEGIGIRLEDVAKELGLTTGELFKAMEKGSIGAAEGLDAVFAAMSKIPGAAGASARQAGNLRGALSNLNDVVDQLIVKALAPLGTYLAVGISKFAEFAGKVLDGTGAYEVARRSIAGVAVALGAIVAAKGAVSVLRLAGAALSIMAANPLVLGIAALGAAVALLPKYAPGVSRFFTSLANGFGIVGKAGYDLKSPIEGLSAIVKFQSSLGAAARVFVDFFRDLSFGFSLWREGFGTGGMTEALRRMLVGIGETLGSARDAIVDGLRPMFRSAERYLSTVRLNIGQFLLPALGLTGGGGGFISRIISSAITKLFLGGIKNFSAETPAAEMGKRLNEIVAEGLRRVKSVGINVGAFLASLFGGSVAVGVAASELGGALNDIVAQGFARLKVAVGPIGDFFTKIGSAIAGWWGKFVLPQLIELPRILGRFLSTVAFSEEFIKAVAAAGAALAGAALIVAGQFIRGFVEGMIARRGDIVEALTDIISFAVKSAFSAGPVGVAALAIASLFIGSKVLGAIGSFRKQAQIAFAGLAGDARKTQAVINRIQLGETGRTTSKVGNAALAIGDGFRKAQSFVVATGRSIEATGKKIVDLQARLNRTANSILNLPATAGTNAAGKLIDTTTGRFIKDTSKELNGFQRYLGQVVGRIAQMTGEIGTAMQRVPRVVQAGFTKAGEFARRFSTELKSEGGAAAAAVAAATGAITGYMTGMADSGKAQVLSFVSALGGIALAFSQGGPILGAIATGTAAIGFFFGQQQKAAQAQKERMEEIQRQTQTFASSFTSTFKDLGTTGPEAKATAALREFQAQVDASDGKFTDLTKKYRLTYADIAGAVALGSDELNRFAKAQRDAASERVATGTLETIKSFPGAFEAGVKAADRFAGSLNKGTFGDTSFKARVKDLADAFRDGYLNLDQFRDGLERIGLSSAEADAAIAAFRKGAAEGIDFSDYDAFFTALDSGIDRAIENYNATLRIQEALRIKTEASLPAAERFAAAYDRIKGSLDKARDAYRKYIDAITGKRVTEAQTALDLLAAGKASKRQDGETNFEFQQRQIVEMANAQQTLNDFIAQTTQDVKANGGGVDEVRRKVQAFLKTLSDSSNDPALKEFIRQLGLTVTPEWLAEGFKVDKPIDNINTLRERFTDFITQVEKRPALVAIQTAPSYEAKRNAIFAQLVELSKDVNVKAFIEKSGGYEKVLAQILGDKGELTEPAEIPVQFKTPPKTEVQLQLDALKRELNFDVPARVVVPPTRREQGGPGATRNLRGASNVPYTPRGFAELGTRATGWATEATNLAATLKVAVRGAILAIDPGNLGEFGVKLAGAFELLLGQRGATGRILTGLSVAMKDMSGEVAGSIGGAIDGELDAVLAPRTLDVSINFITPITSALTDALGLVTSGFSSAFLRRHGGVHEVARYGRIPAHITKHPTILYGERATGGEAMVPRFGDRKRSEAITKIIASWLGGTFIPKGGLAAMRWGGITGTQRAPRGWRYVNGWWYDEKGNRVGFAQMEDAPISWVPGYQPPASMQGFGLLNYPDSPVQTATLAVPELPSVKSSWSSDQSAGDTTINNEVNLTQNIYETTSPRATASEVVRRARSADFLTGGRLLIGSFP